MKRNYLNEIQEIRGRSPKSGAWLDMLNRLGAIERALESCKGLSPELLRYFPTAIVACIEGYFRLQIKELIDSGEPFSENIAKINIPNLKFDFDLVRALTGKTITLGDLVGHLVPINNLDSLAGCISTLIDDDFLGKLGTVRDRWMAKSRSNPPTLIMADPNTVFADISKIFSLRHMFAHELAGAEKVELAEIQKCFQSASTFLKGSAEFFLNLLNPNGPLTQSEMNSDASERFSESEAQRIEITAKLKSKIHPEKNRDFDRLVDSWLAYREACADFDANFWAKGGSMWPTLYWSESKAITDQFIGQMNSWLNATYAR